MFFASKKDEKDSNKKENNNLPGLAAGIAFSALTLPYTPLIAASIGIASIAGVALSTLSQGNDEELLNFVENIFVSSESYVKNDDLIRIPKVLDFNNTDEKITITIKVPFGMTIKDLRKSNDLFLEYFNAYSVKFFHTSNDIYSICIYMSEAALTDNDKFNYIWDNHSIYNLSSSSEKIYPEIAYLEKEDGYVNYYISLLTGKSILDYEKCALTIKDTFKAKDIDFSIANNYDSIFNKFDDKFKYSNIVKISLRYCDEISESIKWKKFWLANDVYTLKSSYNKEPINYLGKTKIPGGFEYLFKVPIGFNYYKLFNMQDNIKSFLHAENIDIINLPNNEIKINALFEKIDKVIDYELIPSTEKNNIEIILGKSIEEYMKVKFTSSMNGLLIVGMTGSGKSNLMRLILLDIALKYKPSQAIMYLADLKHTELSLYKNLVHTERYIEEVDDLAKMIDDLYEIMNFRNLLFTRVGAKDIYTYNSIVDEEDKIPFLIFAIDEVSIFTMSEWANKTNGKGYDVKLTRLNNLSRSAGFINIFSSQRAVQEFLPRGTVLSFSTKIGLKVGDKVESDIITDDIFDCSKLNGNGHAVFLDGSSYNVFQSFCSNNEEELLRKHNLINDTKFTVYENTHFDLEELKKLAKGTNYNDYKSNETTTARLEVAASSDSYINIKNNTTNPLVINSHNHNNEVDFKYKIFSFFNPYSKIMKYYAALDLEELKTCMMLDRNTIINPDGSISDKIIIREHDLNEQITFYSKGNKISSYLVKNLLKNVKDPGYVGQKKVE